MDREPIEVTRADRIYCLKVSSDYHSEVCEECKFYPNCDHMTQDDMTEVTIRDLQKLDKMEQIMKKYQDTLDNFYSGKPRDLLESDVLRDIKGVIENG